VDLIPSHFRDYNEYSSLPAHDLIFQDAIRENPCKHILEKHCHTALSLHSKDLWGGATPLSPPLPPNQWDVGIFLVWWISSKVSHFLRKEGKN
jgi:hypothetical protein